MNEWRLTYDDKAYYLRGMALPHRFAWPGLRLLRQVWRGRQPVPAVRRDAAWELAVRLEQIHGVPLCRVRSGPPGAATEAWVPREPLGQWLDELETQLQREAAKAAEPAVAAGEPSKEGAAPARTMLEGVDEPEQPFEQADPLAPDVQQALLEHVDVLLARGDLQQAAAILDRMLSLDQWSLPTLSRRGRLYLESGEAAEARDLVDRARQRHPEASELLILEGAALAAAGQLQDAVFPLERALAAGCRDIHLLVNLATVHLELQQYEHAIALLQEAELHSPGNPLLTRLKGIATSRWAAADKPS